MRHLSFTIEIVNIFLIYIYIYAKYCFYFTSIRIFKKGVNKNLLKQNFNNVKRGNFNIFQIFNGNIGRGPLLPNSGLFVITKPPNKKWCVLFVRKAMGGDRNRNKPGERYKVGHTYYKTRQRVQAYGKHSGAAGTNPKYWGKWVSIGGKI